MNNAINARESFKAKNIKKYDRNDRNDLSLARYTDLTSYHDGIKLNIIQLLSLTLL